MPVRIQRKRSKGWRLPEGVVSATRPGPYGNPFRIGHWYKIGNGGNGFAWIESYDPIEAERAGYTLIVDAAMAVGWFREYRRRYPMMGEDKAFIRGKDLACWCKIGTPCHADVLLELANQ